MGVFKLGKMTFGSLFKEPETTKYPFEKKPQPAGLKGHIAIDVESCILCGMCDKSCSTDCIHVDKAARTWAIERFQCVQCGYCVRVCPKSCLSMLPDYPAPATKKGMDVYEVPDLSKSGAAGGKKAGDDALAAQGPEPSADASLATENTDPISIGPAQAASEVRAAVEESAIPNGAQNGQVDNSTATARLYDAELEAMLSLMDAGKVEAVREALARHSA